MGVLHNDFRDYCQHTLTRQKEAMLRLVQQFFPASEIYQLVIGDPVAREKLLSIAEYFAIGITSWYGVLGTADVEIDFRGDDQCPRYIIPDVKFTSITALHASRYEAFAKYVNEITTLASKWTLAYKALTFIDDRITDVRVFNYAMPWLSGIAKEFLENEKRAHRTIQACKPLVDRQPPKHLPAIPKEMLDVCRAVTHLQAQAALLEGATHPALTNGTARLIVVDTNTKLPEVFSAWAETIGGV